ncbi:MAG: DUF4139 domain-containing protein [Nitrospirae bacterium]|nr:DUF4139 domain-containing protein [Nitrospirota bacterium]
MWRLFLTLGTLVAVLSLFSPAEARIKLVALPERGETIIRLDNPQATLVEEERVLALQKGLNQVDFSWKGVRIDPDSIRIRILSHPDKVNLLSVSYPPNEKALVWQIFSPEAGEEKIRVSYLLSGIDRLITYKAIANKGETNVDLKSFLVLRNFSGEDFAMAKVQLDYGEAFKKAILNEETKRMLFLSRKDIPIEKTFTFDAAKLPWNSDRQRKNVGIPVHYVIRNDKKSGWGEFALWGGKMRLFQDDGQEGTIFLGEDRAQFTPVGKKMELYVGDSRDIVVTQRKMKDMKINIRRNNKNKIILYDTDEIIKAKMENFKDKPAVLTMVEHIPGQWDMEESSHKFEKEDANTLKFRIEIPAHGEETLIFHYQRRNVQ